MSNVVVESIGSGRYRVAVSEGGTTTTHIVTASSTLRTVDVAPEDLVEASFRFLLDRESKESILKEFDLAVIPRYFPEYDSIIGEYLE